ncbi:S8 family serine peptidase [Actinophytocola oryzae]|uniref:Proprotein convertase P-domain-containing protein n=1 Tax=Actinophytocola oryzae TaxID=502181 RepID=A0A4R7UQI8_9PSEU|nr:S8 family serine peptidase [Actinophytocola oryzae]TDV36066.1 proprotein convertase P-domain-containing protein [Actinophytocola oryzae]
MTGAACLLAVVGLAGPAVAAPQPGDKTISAEKNAANQIAALQDIKKSLSPAEAKVDSQLVLQQRMTTNRASTTAVPMLQNGVEKTASGKVLVDIRATVSDALLKDLAAKGAAVKAVSTRYGSVRAEVPLSSVNTIAARADVRRVEEADGAMTARELSPNGGKTSSETKEQKEKRIAQNTREAISDRAGAVDSEGDRAHNADTARGDIGVTGVGVKICALSDGVDSLATSQAGGELGDVDVLAGQAGSGDEGTAMLEIIHDVAPNAALGFATAFNSDASFADNIRALRFDRGCDIIVDDIIYFKEAPFQDWIIAQAVNDVIADGALYFSSAGNEGNTADGTAGHWEGDYVNSGQIVGKFAGYAHDFDPGPGTQIFEPLSNESAGAPLILTWADPTGGSANDYDLYILDAAGNVRGTSQSFQTGTQDPYERIDVPSGAGLRIAVVKFTGADRYFSLSALRGRFEDQSDLKAFTTTGVTFGHSAARGAFSVAAAPAADPLPFDLEAGDPPNPAGPFPNAFDSSSKWERFSSDGPRKVFFEADGTPITPGNFSSTGGEVRQKPDITAADGVATSVDGFIPFFGTSAAAPHAAAIAGLVLSGNPGIDPAEVREALTQTAIDLGAPGVDPVTGHGVILADRVLGYTGASPQPLAVPETPKVTADDGGAYVDPGDTLTVSLPVTNQGDGTAVSTSVVLTTSTPGVTITPRAQSYGTIPAGETVVKDYKVTVPASQEVGVPIQFTARVTFAGTFSPKTSSFLVDVGRPSEESVAFAYSGAAVPIPDNSQVGATVSIPVSGFGRASKISFSVDGATCSTATGSTTVGIDHTYVGDLVGQLIAPNGTTATVFSNDGGSGNNFCQVVFDDAAATPFATVEAGDAPYSGTWQPASPLDALRGAAVDGTWKFFVRDTAGADTGSVRAVSLHFNGYVRP